MNNTQKLQANIAAKLLCRDKHTWQLAAIGAKRKRYECSSCDAVHIGISLPVAGSDCCSVDIFTDTDVCQEVVKLLGEKYNISIINSWLGDKGKSWGAFDITNQDNPITYGQDTYEDAVGESCIKLASLNNNEIKVLR